MTPQTALSKPPVKTGSPRISIIIPVQNEEDRIESLLRTLREAGSDVELIVVDGQSADGTVEKAREHADQVIICSKTGRAIQMHEGALKASGDILLFLHADTRLPARWKDRLFSAWKKEPKPAATAFRLAFDDSARIFRIMSKFAHWRTRYFTGVPHGDQAIAVDRRVYFRVGGFPDVPLMEEYLLLKRLKGWGPLRLIGDAAVTSSRRYRKNGVLTNVFRNLFILSLFYLGVRPEKLEKLYK